MHPYQKNSKNLLCMNVRSENVYVPFFRRVYSVVAGLFKWSEFEAKWRLSSDQSTQNITWWLGLYLWTWIVAYETHDFIHILQFFTSQFSHRISATDHKESYVYRIQRETNWTVEDVIVRPPRLCLEDRQDISLLIFHAQGFFFRL